MVIKNGKPTVVSAGSAPLGKTISETNPNDISVSSIVGNILGSFNDAALIVIDPHAGRVVAGSSVGQRGALIGAIDNPNVLYLQPDANQSGRSLAFSASAGNNLAGIVLTDLTVAVKPKFTVETLVNRLLAKVQEREAAVPADAGKFFIVVDQVNKKVGILKADDEAATRIDLLGNNPLNSGEAINITLTPEATDSVSNPLPFEGGAV